MERFTIEVEITQEPSGGGLVDVSLPLGMTERDVRSVQGAVDEMIHSLVRRGVLRDVSGQGRKRIWFSASAVL